MRCTPDMGWLHARKSPARLACSARLIDGMGLFEGRGRVRRAVVEDLVLEIGADAGGNHRSILRGSEEDVLRQFWNARKPVRVVKGPGINAECGRKPFEREVELGAAGRTEIDGDLLAASRRGQGIGRGLSRNDFKIRLHEDGL